MPVNKISEVQARINSEDWRYTLWGNDVSAYGNLGRLRRLTIDYIMRSEIKDMNHIALEIEKGWFSYWLANEKRNGGCLVDYTQSKTEFFWRGMSRILQVWKLKEGFQNRIAMIHEILLEQEIPGKDNLLYQECLRLCT